jgi:hypothetical protein
VVSFHTHIKGFGRKPEKPNTRAEADKYKIGGPAAAGTTVDEFHTDKFFV